MSRIKNRQSKAMQISVIGRVKIGQKDPQRGFPTSLDYFRIVPELDPDSAAKNIAAILGEKPESLTIIFPSDNVSEVCPNFYILRDGSGKRVATSDGENVTIAVQQDGQVRDVLYTPEDYLKKHASCEAFMIAILEGVQAKTPNEKTRAALAWKEQLTLRFLILGLPYIGAWQLDTRGAESSIPGIVEHLDFVKGFAGRLQGIPFSLSVKKVKSDKAGDGRSYPVLTIAASLTPENMEKLQSLPQGFSGLLTNEKINQLEVPKVLLLNS